MALQKMISDRHHPKKAFTYVGALDEVQKGIKFRLRDEAALQGGNDVFIA